MSSNKINELVGYTMNDNWEIISRLEIDTLSNVNFIKTYKVKRNEEVALLKCLDFNFAFESSQDTVKVMRYISNIFHNETTLLELCKDNNLSHVVQLISRGEFRITEDSNSIPYIIIEYSGQTVETEYRLDSMFNTIWIFTVLHNISVGLWQLEKQNISVDLGGLDCLVNFGNDIYKIGDLGESRLNGEKFDLIYVTDERLKLFQAVESLYNYELSNIIDRNKTRNLFTLGSVMIFLFSNLDANAWYYQHLREEHKYFNWRGSYEEVIPFLDGTTEFIIELICNVISCSELEPKLREIIPELLTVDPVKRGKKLKHNPYSMERYVTEVKLLNDLYIKFSNGGDKR